MHDPINEIYVFFIFVAELLLRFAFDYETRREFARFQPTLCSHNATPIGLRALCEWIEVVYCLAHNGRMGMIPLNMAKTEKR